MLGLVAYLLIGLYLLFDALGKLGLYTISAHTLGLIELLAGILVTVIGALLLFRHVSKGNNNTPAAPVV